MGNIFLQILLFIYYNLAFQNLGLAIIEIAVLTRLFFYPLVKQQAYYSKKMGELQPSLSALQAKHKSDRQALAQAQMELFKKHGVNPAAGCLPAVVQIVILFGLFGAIKQILRMNLNTSFLIWDMAKPDAYQLGGIPFLLPGFLVLMAATSQFVLTKMMVPKPPKIRREDKSNERKEKSDFMADFAEAQSSYVWMFPLIFLFFGSQWPSGLALYWSTSSILAIVQQYQSSGFGGLKPFMVKLSKVVKK